MNMIRHNNVAWKGYSSVNGWQQYQTLFCNFPDIGQLDDSVVDCSEYGLFVIRANRNKISSGGIVMCFQTHCFSVLIVHGFLIICLIGYSASCVEFLQNIFSMDKKMIVNYIMNADS